VLEVTNRFDWGVQDKDVYYNTLRQLSHHPRFHVVANNPFEEYYMGVMNNVNFPVVRLLRPVGISPISGNVNT
jgi:hypothetical protein